MTEVVSVIARGEVSLRRRVVRGRVRADADAFVARESRLPACLARVDDALGRLATHRDGTADLGAVLTFARRRTTAARVESLGDIETLVCDSGGSSSRSAFRCE